MRSVLLLGLVAGWLAGCERGAGAATEEEATPRGQDTAGAAELAANLPPGVTPQMVEEGRKLFLPCAVCHGLDGRGNQLGPSLRDSAWTHIAGSREEIEQLIRSGVPAPKAYPIPMVPMGGGAFSDEQLQAVAAYVYVISHNPSPAAP